MNKKTTKTTVSVPATVTPATVTPETVKPVMEVSIFNSRALSQDEIREYLDKHNMKYSEIDGQYLFSVEPTDSRLRVPKEALRSVKETEIPSLMAKFEGVGQLNRAEIKIVELLDGEIVFLIVNGMQRHRVCTLLKLSYKVQTNQKANLLTSMIHNIGVINQNVNEVYNAIALCVQSGMSYEEITKKLDYTSEKIENHFKLTLLKPEFRAKVLSSEISFNIGKEIANAINSGKFTQDQVNDLYDRAEGNYKDKESGTVLPAATVENIKSAKKSMLTLTKTVAQAIKEGKTRPDFEHKPEFIQARLEEMQKRYFMAKSKEEANGLEDLNSDESCLVTVFDYIYNMREEDIVAAKNAYNALYGLKELGE